LNIPLYVSNVQQNNGGRELELKDLFSEWQEQSAGLRKDMTELFKTIESDL
jgi:hypothetical protein